MEFIVKNKQEFKSKNNDLKNNISVLALKNSMRSGTIINEDDIVVIKKRVNNKNDLVKNKTDLVGKN